MAERKNDFDVVIGGSSPIMMMIALKCAKDFGKSVAILDAASTPGGAWAPQHRFGHEVDNGPHLLYNFNTNILPLLAEVTRLGKVKFHEMKPPPRSDSLLHHRNMEYSFGFDKATRARKLVRMAKDHLQKVRGRAKNPYHAPIGGLSSFSTCLTHALETENIPIISNDSVTSLDQFDNSVIVKTNNTTYRGEKFVGSGRIIANIVVDGLKNILPARHLSYFQSYLLIQSESELFSYFRFFRDGKFFLAADLTASARPQLPYNRRILSVNLLDGVRPEDVDNHEIASVLKRKGLIGQGDEILDMEWEKMDNIENVQSVKLDNISNGKRYHFVQCNNMVRSLHNYLMTDNLKKFLERK